MEDFERARELFLEGIAFYEKAQFDLAEVKFSESLKLVPDRISTMKNLSATLLKQKKFEAAKALCFKILSIDSASADAWHYLGLIDSEQLNQDDAIAKFDKALSINQNDAAVLNNKGVSLNKLAQLDAALACFDKAVAIKPDYAEAYYNRGNTLKELKRWDEALDSYNRATSLKPDFAEAYNNRGVALQKLTRSDEALDSYDVAIRIKPDYAEAYYNRGNALKELKRLDEALDSYDRATRLKPDYAEAYISRGVALRELGRGDEALDSHDRAIRLKPDYAEAYYNRGSVLVEQKRLGEALDSYDRSIRIAPHLAFAYGAWLHTKMKLCDWTDLENQIAECIKSIERNKPITPSFPVLALVDSLVLQRKAAEIWVNNKCPASRALPSIAKRPRREKIRVGYFSADYHDHATTYLMAGLFEGHDRSKFEVTAFSFGPDHKDGMRKRLSAAFDRFVDVCPKSDKEIALLSRKLEIDIAVDLKGFTQDGRAGIFSYRAAPIQVNYLGYPGTMGAEYIDYLVADRTLIPDACQPHYSEKIVYLPNSYQVNDRKRPIADRRFSREELGLPRSGFVFCCFNYSYKLNPGTFDGWMRILKQAEGSVLWLFEDNPTATTNLRKEAKARGLIGERLIFAKHMPLPEHLARLRAADLFLDTLPCNAHTTASDALWVGLPVLTRIGEAFAGRVAASLLNAIDVPELITTTQEQYEALAVELATDRGRLEVIREKLAKNRSTKPLFDTELFTEHLEDAYRQMYERYQADLPPEHIYVRS
jgi:protein O-GlcNAc transferase